VEQDKARGSTSVIRAAKRRVVRLLLDRVRALYRR
jgi:hypothetical protein